MSLTALATSIDEHEKRHDNMRSTALHHACGPGIGDGDVHQIVRAAELFYGFLSGRLDEPPKRGVGRKRGKK